MPEAILPVQLVDDVSEKRVMFFHRTDNTFVGYHAIDAIHQISLEGFPYDNP